MNKEDVVHIYNGILAIKKNEVMSFVATWMDIEIIMLSEVSQTQIPYDIAYMWDLKRMIQMNLLIKQKQAHRLREEFIVARGKG